MSDVLNRTRFRRYADYETVRLFLESLTSRARSVDVHMNITACRDPKDDKFPFLAVSGGATYIVNGDKDLLALDPFQGIRILTPSDFLALPRTSQLATNNRSLAMRVRERAWPTVVAEAKFHPPAPAPA